MHTRSVALALGVYLLMPLASADTIYKCVEGGKTTYTSTPCGGGTAKELVYVAPTAEERRSADAKRQVTKQQLDDSLAQQRASEEAYYQARMEAAARRAEFDAAQPRIDPRDNEKVMVHTPSGWDYKTRAQIIAEENAKAARADANRPVLINGTPYPRSGQSGVLDPKTGRYCPLVGNTAFCN